MKNKKNNNSNNDLSIIIIGAFFIIGLVGLYRSLKYLFHREPIIVENTNNEEDIPVIIIVGRTGSGKSTLANVLLGEEKFAEVPGSSSGTKNIQSENFRWNGKHYRVIDTIGTGDTTELSDNEIYSTIDQINNNLGGNKIKRIFFVYKDRFTEEQVKAFQAFNRFFQASPYITIVCSNFVEFKDRGKCEADIKKLLKENKSIAGVIKGCKVIHVDNPPLQYNNAREIRQCSREKLLNYLDEIASEKPNTEDIDVDKIIKELEN